MDSGAAYGELGGVIHAHFVFSCGQRANTKEPTRYLRMKGAFFIVRAN